VQTVNVYTQPKASFTINAQAQCVNTNSFAFTSTSTAGLGTLTYNWDFGDGTISSLAAPVHTYALEGTYTIKLIVTSSNGCKDSATQTVTLYPKPSPLFVISDAAQCLVGNSFSFTNGSSISSGSITSYWVFNDGTTSLEKEPSHIYIQAGNYAPKLVVISDKGCKDSLTRPLIVHANPLVKIQANKNIALCKGSTVQLNVTGAQSYTWNPADYLSCTTCSDPVAAPVAGSIMYTVIGKNAADCPGQDSVRIQVIPPFTIQTANDTICLNESARLNATGAVTYNWSPATGLSSTTIVNPLASPAVTTTYRVVGYDGFNCFTDTAYAKVVVLPTPVVNLGPDLNLSTGTLQPLTNSIQNGPITRWIWSPQKDLSCTDCPLPTAYIRNEVTYRVHVTNTYGCSNADTINIKAFCESGQLYIANAFTPDGDGINDILMVQGKGIASIKSFRIFNRWGELLFEKMNFAPNDPKHGWDGKIKGRSGPSDVFVYTAEVICENGTPFFFKGNISILK
jgi:gliding motility-associated-like protein